MSKVSRWIMAVVVVGLLGASSNAMAEKTTEVDSAQKTRIQEDYGKLPLYFIQNNGQMDEKVKFYEKGSGHSTFFTEDGVFLQLSKEQESQLIKLIPQGANKNPEIIAEGMQKGKINYFIGKKENWKRNISTYRAIIYKDVYDGVDMKFYGNNRQLEYDIIVKPGIDPSQVVLSYEGIESLEITDAGELKIVLKDGYLTQKTPYLYQEIDGKRVEVEGKFKILASQSTYGFEIASYNKDYPLIIDPILVYSTYLGGSDTDNGYGIAVDTSGNAYITGEINSTDFPTQNPIYTDPGDSATDAFVTKINAAGNALVYSTYLGGSGDDWGNSITVDAAGCAYVSGLTSSDDFPTASAYQGNHGGGTDGFVTKISIAGNALEYSSFLGGNGFDIAYRIAVDTSGNSYVAGHTTSTDFPTVSAIQGSFAGIRDAFITKINTAGSALVYSTYLGGSGEDIGFGIAVDTSGNAYITGETSSTDFPTQNPIYTDPGDSNADGFVTKINAAGNALEYSTYLGGNDNDWGYSITVDAAGFAYVIGDTSSSDFPTVSAYQGSSGGGGDSFVTKINAAGNALEYSTYLGGSSYEMALDIAVDTSGNAYITGATSSTDFPTVSAIQGSGGGAFVTKINAAGNALEYSTYLGGSSYEMAYGIAVDAAGDAYVIGTTSSTDFPTVSPIQGNLNGTSDVFVTKIGDAAPPSTSVTPTPDNATPSTGDTVCIQTDVADVTDLYAVSFDMLYSASNVTFSNATEGSFLDNGTPADAQMLAGLLDGTEGQLVVGITRLGDVGGVTGSGDLADICLDVIGAACSSTDISYTNTLLEGPGQGDTIAASWGTTSITVALPDATALSAVDAGTHDQLNLSWTAAAGATSYDIYRSDSSGSGFSFLDNTGGTTYPDSDCIIPTLSYYYYVVAKVGSCESNPTAEESGIAAGLLGDINNDGRVDGRDLSILARNFGTNDHCPADLDRTDLIDGDDLIAIAANFGLTLP